VCSIDPHVKGSAGKARIIFTNVNVLRALENTEEASSAKVERHSERVVHRLLKVGS